MLSRKPNAPSNGQTQQQKQQDCLNKINNTPDGKFYNFWSLTSPLIGPNRLDSAIEDFGGTGLKYLAYRGLLQAADSPTLLEGSNAQFVTAVLSGAAAEGIHTVAKEVVFPLALAATAGQLTVHAGCAIASHF